MQYHKQLQTNNNKDSISQSHITLKSTNYYSTKKENYDIQNIIPNSKSNSRNKFFSHTTSSDKPMKNEVNLELELKKYKLNYISLNNDNLIYKEDIEKLVEMNKNLEKELVNERNHNLELAKEFNKLKNDNQNLNKEMDEISQKISHIKMNSQKEKEYIDKKIYIEGKLKERELECKKIFENNHKLNIEYNLLNDKFNTLKNKNKQNEIELNSLKQEQENKISDIETKLFLLMEEMEKIKNENNELCLKNEKLRKNITKNENEKNEYYNKYQEQKDENIMINKEINELNLFYQECRKKFEKEEEKQMIQNNIMKYNSKKKFEIINDLQKRIRDYKIKRKEKDLDEFF